MWDQFPTFWGEVSNKKITESRLHPVSGIWRKYFSSCENSYGFLRVTTKFFVKSGFIFPKK